MRKLKLEYACFVSLAVAAITAIPAFFADAGEGPGIAEAIMFDRAVTAIEQNYVDPDRIAPKKMLAGALAKLQRTIPEILVKDASGGAITVEVGLAEKRIQTGEVSTLENLKHAMREILSFIAENYHGATPPEEIEYAAIDGLLEALDPHSNFMPPKVYNEFKVGTRGKFGGLGIVISIKDGQLTVIAPIEDTPAGRAGIKSGDHILEINDESTINMSLTDAVNKLRGDIGSKVSIVLARAGGAPQKVTLTRALINIDSVKLSLLVKGGKRIGYLKLKSFQSNTEEDVKAALKSFHEGGAKLDGLILDLRNNPGGLLNIAVDTVDHFLNEGIIVTTVGPRDEVVEKETAHAPETEEKYPLVVLINEGSASASEIVAGALQINNRAVIMGRRSFGKGSVQTIFELGGGSALKLTIAQYKPAGVQNIQIFGVTPDVDLQAVTVDNNDMNLVEDVLPSEFDLEQHLTSAIAGLTAEPQSPHHVRYLKPKESEKDAEAQSASEYAKTPDIEKDFAVDLAQRVIANAGKDSRRETLSGIGATLKKAGEEQEKLIDSALKPLNIDWTDAKPDGGARLTLSYHLVMNKMRTARVTAGSKINIELTATNTGTGPYSRLIAVGQSDMPFLMNREFVFGLVPPGATRTAAVSVEIPESLPTEDLVMDVAFTEAHGRMPNPLNIVIPVDALPEGQFAFKFTLPQNFKGKPWPQKVSIPLNFEITNVGAGATSKDTTATLSNECGEGIFIENGRANLSIMPPGSSKKAVFKFRIAPDAKSRQKCELKLTVADPKRLTVLAKNIELVLPSGEIKPAPGVRHEPPSIELAKLPSSTANENLKIAGMVKDTDPIRDYYIFVGDKKVAYVPNAGNTSSMQFETTIPLEPGANFISIGARDAEDLTGRKIVVVERTSGEKKKRDRRFQTLGVIPGRGPYDSN